MLSWEFDGRGQWDAISTIYEESFTWRIVVCDDGSFDVSESDGELTNRKECFPTLASAKAFCESSEVTHVF